MSHYDKTCHQGFQTAPTKTELYCHGRWLEALIKKVDELYYLCSENKGADQVRNYCTADLRLCFAFAKSRFSQDAT